MLSDTPMRNLIAPHQLLESYAMGPREIRPGAEESV
jgi:hypothetical protein